MKLTKAEIAQITELLEAGGALPDKWRQRLFQSSSALTTPARNTGSFTTAT